MGTPGSSVVNEHTPSAFTTRTSTLGHPAGVERTSSPASNSLFRTLAVCVLSGAAVLGQVSPVDAQAGGPFNATCDNMGVSGTAYVPGVNCRFMSVDGYIRRYIVFVPPGGVPAGS